MMRLAAAYAGDSRRSRAATGEGEALGSTVKTVTRTVEKALLLIEALSRAKEPCGVTQLAKELDFHKSTVHRLLETLHGFGYVRHADESARYVLTTKLWELGVGVVQGLSLREVASPFLVAVARETGETPLITIPDGH